MGSRFQPWHVASENAAVCHFAPSFPQCFAKPRRTAYFPDKDTSLVSAIAAADLTLQARNVISETYLSFEIWIIVAVLYFLLTLFVSVPALIFAQKR